MNGAAYVPPAGRYVPPAARKMGVASSSGSLAERMRKEREATTVVATKVVQKTSSPAVRVPIGMIPVSTKKGSTTSNKEKHQEAKPKIEKTEEKKPETGDVGDNTMDASDPEKRSKKLKKLLKQIEELKGKDPSTLNPDQIQKIVSEEDVRKELASLNM
jgi:hypothetical protein